MAEGCKSRSCALNNGLKGQLDCNTHRNRVLMANLHTQLTFVHDK